VYGRYDYSNWLCVRKTAAGKTEVVHYDPVSATYDFLGNIALSRPDEVLLFPQQQAFVRDDYERKHLWCHNLLNGQQAWERSFREQGFVQVGCRGVLRHLSKGRLETLSLVDGSCIASDTKVHSVSCHPWNNCVAFLHGKGKGRWLTVSETDLLSSLWSISVDPTFEFNSCHATQAVVFFVSSDLAGIHAYSDGGHLWTTSPPVGYYPLLVTKCDELLYCLFRNYDTGRIQIARLATESGSCIIHRDIDATVYEWKVCTGGRVLVSIEGVITLPDMAFRRHDPAALPWL
jgi:hypothetical protein